MPALAKVAALHGALWNVDPWYRRSWVAGPLSLALMVCGWIVAQPQRPGNSADIPWAAPLSAPGSPPPFMRPATPGQGSVPADLLANRFAPPGWKPPLKPGEAAQAQPAAPGAAANARRAALYEDDAADPKGKRSEGTVTWHSDEIAGAADQPKQISIKAEIELPGRGIKMTLSLHHNTDASLPASHLAELAVTVPPDFPGGGIASVLGIMMKQNEQAKGVPLVATVIKAYDGLFLIGLTNSDGERARNMRLLEYYPWFDIAVVYTNQRRAIITFEKGDTGEIVFRQAFGAWRQ